MPVPRLPAEHQLLTQPGQREILVTASLPEKLISRRIRGCLRANSEARIICLAHMPVGSTDLEDTSRLLPAQKRQARRHRDGGREPEDLAEDGRPAGSSRQGGGDLSGVTGAHMEVTHWNMVPRPGNPAQKLQMGPARNSQRARFSQRCERKNWESAHLLLKPQG